MRKNWRIFICDKKYILMQIVQNFEGNQDISFRQDINPKKTCLFFDAPKVITTENNQNTYIIVSGAEISRRPIEN